MPSRVTYSRDEKKFKRVKDDSNFISSGYYDKKSLEGSDGVEIPFHEITAQVLSDEPDVNRGFTSYDYISRTLHQLARDGNHELLALVLDRLGDQCQSRVNRLDGQKMAPLHYAARYSHPYTILTLLQRKAKVNIKGYNDITPLHCAARYRKSLHSAKRRAQLRERSKAPLVSRSVDETEDTDKGLDVEGDQNGTARSAEDLSAKSFPPDDEGLESVVKVLIENGADVHAQDVYGLTPLHYAAMRGHAVAARDLLQYGNVDTEIKDKQQMTPLFIAVTYGYVDICHLLIKHGADIVALDESQETILHRAATEGHLEIVKLLLDEAKKQGGEAQVKKYLSMKDAERQTPFQMAVMNGNTEAAKLLLERGSDVNAVRDTLATPLHSAAISGDVELINLLIEHGANIEALDSNHQTAIHKAAICNHSGAISALVKHNTKIERKDKDSFTPLLLAASCGRAEAMAALLEHGAQVDVIDKDDQTVVFWCAKYGYLDGLKVLLDNPKAATLVDFSDRFDNSPLHEAARNGFIDVVKLLLERGSQIDNKNEDEETAMHIAAEMGHKDIVSLFISRYRFLTHDENEDGDTPLHLASAKGHTDVVDILLEASADVEARNTLLWTPLDCAAANGHYDICKMLIDHDSPLDPLDKTKTTPLQLAAQNGHVEVTKLLLERGASVSSIDTTDRNALEIAIAAGQQDVALAIVQSDQWLDSLKNSRYTVENNRKITPFRLLVQRFPEVAKVVLDRCITTNGKEPDEVEYGIKFNFEFVDDTYIINESDSKTAFLSSSESAFDNPFDEYGRIYEQAIPYTTEPRLLKSNHPLMMMVQYKRTGLLGHPVSVSLLKHKWLSYARFVYYFNIVFYTIFLGFLTAYVCNGIDWNYVKYLLMKKNMTIPPELTCKEAETLISAQRQNFNSVAQWVIIVMTVLNICKEIFQIYQARFHYLGFDNLVEWMCYIGALVLVIDWTGSTPCYVKEIWQWQLGAVVIFLAWLNLVLFFRKLPLFGIYVVMFTDICATFTRFFVVFVLFIIGFGLSFFMLFRTQVPFEYVGKSLLKTSVMMIGEFEYDAIFNKEDGKKVPYPFVSYIMFVFFLIVMSILVMNLLIGLAVDDIKGVQDQAALKRRAMQTELILNVEVLIPEALRRYFATSFRKFYPNKKRSTYKKVFSDFNLLHTFDYANLNEGGGAPEDLVTTLNSLKAELTELKEQNQKMYSLFSTSLLFHKRMKRLEQELLEKE